MSSVNQSTDQTIDFNKVEDQSPTLIFSNNITVIPSGRTLETQSKASTKITTQNVVDYTWQNRYCLGHLITYHASTKLIAYVLDISNSYMIRILNEENSSRCLIKDFTGEVIDIAFSKSKIPYIASIDVNGYVKINKVIINQELIDTELILKIEPRAVTDTINLNSKVFYSRVMWCGNRDAEDDEVDNNSDDEMTTTSNIVLLLGIVHGSSFDIIQVDTLEAELRSLALEDEGEDSCSLSNNRLPDKYQPNVTRDQLFRISCALQQQYQHNTDTNLTELFLPYLTYTAGQSTSPSSTSTATTNSDITGGLSPYLITCFAISSDAGAFAAGLKDGTVRFFTLDGSAKTGIKEEYSWTPFQNESACSLLFLDDSRPGCKVDSYWCHVIVGSSFNRKLKLYRCDKWDCIQTINIDSGISTPCLLTAHLDESACFLLASDLNRKVLYVLEIGILHNGRTRLFKSLQEFVLSEPMLSFDINTVSQMPTTDGYQQIVIKLFTITRSAFQKMRVSYHSRGHRMLEIPLFDDKESISVAHPPDASTELTGEANKSMVTPPDFEEDEPVDEEGVEDGDDEEDEYLTTGSSLPAVLPLLQPTQQYKDLSGPTLLNGNCNGNKINDNLYKSTSTITKISSMPPSITSSFHDPAIIASHIPPDMCPTSTLHDHHHSHNHHLYQSAPPGATSNKHKLYPSITTCSSTSTSTDVPVALQHLFSAAAAAAASSSASVCSTKTITSLTGTLPPITGLHPNTITTINPLVTSSLTTHPLPQPSSANQDITSIGLSLANISDVIAQNDSGEESGDEASDELVVCEDIATTPVSASMPKSDFPNPPNPELDEVMLLLTQQQTQLQEITEKFNQLNSTLALIQPQQDLAQQIQVSINQLSHELRETITVQLDTSTKHTIHQLSHDRQLHDSIARAVASTVERSISTVLIDFLRKQWTPALNNSIDKLIVESGNVLRDATHQLLVSTETQHNSNFSGLEHKLIAAMAQQHNQSSQKNIATITDSLTGQIKSQLAGLHNDISAGIIQHYNVTLKQSVDDIKECVEGNISKLQPNSPLENQMFQMMSHTNSLANIANSSNDPPHLKAAELRERKIKHAIANGDVTTAITEALSLTDLNFLLSILSKFTPQQVFSSRNQSKLTEAVVLSLIQQISRDFHDNFELKFNYLMEALLTTSFSKAITAQKTLRNVERRMQLFIDHPSANISNKDRMRCIQRLVHNQLNITSDTNNL